MIKLISNIGKSILNFISEFGQIALFLYRIIKYFPRIIKDRRLLLEQMVIVGTDSLPLVILIGIFTGVIAALQATMLWDNESIRTN